MDARARYSAHSLCSRDPCCISVLSNPRFCLVHSRLVLRAKCSNTRITRTSLFGRQLEAGRGPGQSARDTIFSDTYRRRLHAEGGRGVVMPKIGRSTVGKPKPAAMV